MLEYLFFNETVLSRFTKWLNEKKIPFSHENEPIQDAFIVLIEEPTNDELWDEIDSYFDDLSDEDQALMEAGAEFDGDKSRAGVYIQLSGEKQTIAKVDPDILNRILSVISMDELNLFIDAVVTSVENPDDSAICDTGEH
ncbi:MAG: hypothetical protein ACWA5X_01745 [bacterium]